MHADQDLISIPPTIAGKHARAWRLDFIAILALLERRRDEMTVIVTWLIEAVWASKTGEAHSYKISLGHLRPVACMPDAVIYLEGATHQIVVEALDPRYPRQFALDKGDFAVIEPANFAAQMVKSSDAAAEIAIGVAVRMICDGVLNPDAEWRANWAAIFGDNMMTGHEED